MRYLILFLCFSFTAVSQNQFIYEYTITDQSKGYNNQEEMLLYFDQSVSIFTSLKSLLNLRDFQNQKALEGSINLTVADFPKINSKVIKQKNTLYYYDFVLGAQLRVKVSPSDDWRLLKDTKIVNGKTLNKASIQLYDRLWTAWYDLSIPIQEGPYFFKGLPGLIIELYDEDKIHHFVFKGKLNLEFSLQELGLFDQKKYREISLTKYKNFVREGMKNPFETYNANATLKLFDRSVDQIKVYNTNYQRSYNSLLLKDV